MAIRLSTGLKSALYTNFGFTAMMGYGTIKVYSGPQPTSADDAPTGTYLGVITQDGLTFVPGTTTGGLAVALNESAQLAKSGTWQFNGVNTGTAGWWRWVWNGGAGLAIDDDSSSLYYPRMDGLVGESLQLVETSITPATQFNITTFALRFVEG